MASNFEFLKSEFQVLANFGELAEKYCFSDSNSCLMKLGMIGEMIVKGRVSDVCSGGYSS